MSGERAGWQRGWRGSGAGGGGEAAAADRALGFRPGWAGSGLGRRLIRAAPGGVPLGYGPESVRVFLIITRRKTNKRNTKRTPKIPK